MEIWKYCWNCKHETPQKRSFFKMFPIPVEGFTKDPNTAVATSIWTISIDSYQLCECKKCDAPLLHLDTYKLKSIKDEIEQAKFEYKELSDQINNFGHCDKHEYKSHSYPDFDASSLKDKKWSFNLPEEDMLLFFEVISAWDRGLFILALSGVRTLIDRYIVKKIGDIGNFQAKLSRMLDNKHINQKQFELLNTVIEAGNAAGHRGFKPEKEMLTSLLMVVEDIMSLEYKTLKFDEYKKSIPPRAKKTSK
jgi:hypothetical protein